MREKFKVGVNDSNGDLLFNYPEELAPATARKRVEQVSRLLDPGETVVLIPVPKDTTQADPPPAASTG